MSSEAVSLLTGSDDTVLDDVSLRPTPLLDDVSPLLTPAGQSSSTHHPAWESLFHHNKETFNETYTP